MLRLPHGRQAPLWLAVLTLSILPSTGHTQPKPQKFLFDSFDKVELQGTWYPSSAEGTKSPVVLLLHKYGGSRLQEGWETLAQALQDKGFAVLSFDFRGHGDSTTVKPEFWNYPTNLRGIKGGNPKKETINYKEFGPGYVPFLINDIAAAKFAIEQKNNARECNANDIIIVGAEEGASLGLMWVATEWKRYKRVYNQLGQISYNPEPEAKDLAALVSLSIRPEVGAVKVPTQSIFANQKMREFGLCFFYGEEDTKAKSFTSYIYDKVLAADKNKQLKLTYSIPAEKTKLAGHELLSQKALGISDLVVKYIAEKVREVRPAKVWLERDVGGPGRPILNPLAQVSLSTIGINLP